MSSIKADGRQQRYSYPLFMPAIVRQGGRRTGVLHSDGRERTRHGRRKRVQGRGNNMQCTPHLPLLGIPLFFFRPHDRHHIWRAPPPLAGLCFISLFFPCHHAENSIRHNLKACKRTRWCSTRTSIFPRKAGPATAMDFAMVLYRDPLSSLRRRTIRDWGRNEMMAFSSGTSALYIL